MTNFNTPIQCCLIATKYTRSLAFSHHSAYLQLLLNSLANYGSNDSNGITPQLTFWTYNFSSYHRDTFTQSRKRDTTLTHVPRPKPSLSDWKVKNCSHVTFIVCVELSILVDLTMFLLANERKRVGVSQTVDHIKRMSILTSG